MVCADALKSRGDPEAAKVSLLQAISLEAYREVLHRSLIMPHIASGERGLALAQFRTCCEILRRELDVAPSDETFGLADSISGTTPPAKRSDRTGRARAAATPLGYAKPAACFGPCCSFIHNLGGNAEAGAIVDGIVEDIITDLMKFPSLGSRSAALRCNSKVQ